MYTEGSYHPTTHNGVFVVNLLIRPIHCQFSYPDNQELVKLLTGQPYVVSCFRYGIINLNVLLFFSPFIIILLFKLDITVVDACKSYWQFEETDSLTRFYYVLHEIPILLLEIYMICSRFLLLIYIPSSGHHFESVVPLLQVIFSHLFETTGQNVLVTKLDTDVHWVAPVQHLYF